MWDGGEQFNKGLFDLIAHPIKNPQAYQTKFNPLRSCVAVLGHELSNKTAYVQHFCETNELPYFVFSFEKSISVTKSLELLSNKLAEQDMLLRKTMVLILENADQLAFECDSQEALRRALRLKEWIFQDEDGQIARGKLITVCMMNRIDSPNQNLEFLSLFYDQFKDAVLYFPPPTSNYVKDYVKLAFQNFANEYDTRLKKYYGNRDVPLELTDEDYTCIAEASRHASMGHIHEYLHRVWHAICSTDSMFTLKGSVVCGAPFMQNGHITRKADQIKKQETNMADAAGVPDHIESSTKRMRL